MLLYKKRVTGGSIPFGLSFSPKGNRIAIGFSDRGHVNILSGRNLSLLYSPDLAGLESGDNLNKLAWSEDDRWLYGGGMYRKKVHGKWYMVIRKWSAEGGGQTRDILIPIAYGTIVGLKPLKGGELVYAARGSALGLIDQAGMPHPSRSPRRPIIETI